MSEISLQEKNTQLTEQLQESTKREKSHSKAMRDLNLRLVQIEEDNTKLRTDTIYKVKRDCSDRLQKVKQQLKMKESEHKQMDIRCAGITRALACLTTKFQVQKNQLETTKQNLASAQLSQAESVKATQGAQQHIAELNKQLAVAQCRHDELQKSLLREKKMSRFFIKERDQLLEEQDSRFKNIDKELVKLKQSERTLTELVGQKIGECESLKESSKVMMKNYQKKSAELKRKLEEMEKREQELTKKTCEYCGF